MRIIVFVFLFFLNFLYSPIFSQDTEKLDYFDKAYGLFFKNIDSSIFYLHKGLDYYPSKGEWKKYINCHNALTSAYGIKGNLNQSYAHALQAFSAAEEHLNDDGVALGSALNNLAIFTRRKGDYDKAIPLYQRALEIERRSGKLTDELVILYNLGNCFSNKGDYFESKKYYSQVINIGQDQLGTNHPTIIASYLDLADIFNTIGQTDTAYVLYQQVLKQINTQSETDIRIQKRLISIHLKLGEFFWEQNKEKLSKKHIHQAMVFSQKHFEQESSEAYVLLGRWAKHQQNYPLAIQHFKKAQLFHQKKNRTLGKSTETGLLYKNLAATYFENGNFKNSLQNYQAGLEQYSKNFKPTNHSQNPKLLDLVIDQGILEILQGKANTQFQSYFKSKDQSFLLAAQATYQLAIQLLNKLRQSYHGTGSKEVLAENVIPIFEGALDCTFALHKIQPSQKLLNEAFQIAENSKAILLLESINETTALGLSGIPNQLLAKEKELKLDITYHQKQLIATDKKEVEKIKAIETGLFELEKKHQDLIQVFEKDYPDYHQLKYNTTIVNIEELKKKLNDKKSIMLEYFVGEKHLYLFSISPEQTSFIQIKKRTDLHQQIQEIRNLLIHPPGIQNAQEDFEQFTKTSHSLYQQLITPAIIKEGIHQIVLIPDDVLAYIPFEALIANLPSNKNIDYTSSNLNYLLNQFQISYNYSATLFAQDRKAPKKAINDFIGFAPSFGENNTAGISLRDCSQDQLYNLICNKEEVQQISDLFQGDAILGKQASKESFMKSIGTYRITHFATHSCLNDKNPMLNKIFLADDYLSNFDLYNLQLNTELTVLSACNTGSGQLRRGEGVMSLSRGFMHAGCPSVLMSLWSVEDCSTSTIMNTYYQGIKAGKAKDLALQVAKQTYLQEANKLACHPFYWAPFIQFGSVEKMDFGRPWINHNLIGLCLLFALAMLMKLLRNY